MGNEPRNHGLADQYNVKVTTAQKAIIHCQIVKWRKQINTYMYEFGGSFILPWAGDLHRQHEDSSSQLQREAKDIR